MLTAYAFKFVSLSLVVFCGMVLVVLMLCSARKEFTTGEPIKGLLPLALFIATLCVIVALCAIYFERNQGYAHNVRITEQTRNR
jgi:hypothetical protein